MRKLISALLMGAALNVGLPTRASADVSFNLSIGEREGFYLGLSNYYGVPQDRVLLLVDQGLPYDEVTVALYIADLARVDPFEVADLRLSGMRWIDVSHYYGLGADVYYVEEEPYGPYVTYYEQYRTHPRSAWVHLELSDVAIVNLANLRFGVQHYGVSPRYVMDWRARGSNFMHINHQLFRERGRMPMRPVAHHRVKPQALPEPLRMKARKHRPEGVNRRERAMKPGTQAPPVTVDEPRRASQRAERQREAQRMERREARQVEERRETRREKASERNVPPPRISETQKSVPEAQPVEQEKAPKAGKGKEARTQEKAEGKRQGKNGKGGKGDKDKKQEKP